MSEVGNNELMLAIKELGNKLNVVIEDLNGVKQDVNGIKQELSEVKQDVSHMKQDMSIMKQDIVDIKQALTNFKNDTNLNFRKLEKKISIPTKDVFDVRTDMTILEEQVK